jgi:hypothetical protein
MAVLLLSVSCGGGDKRAASSKDAKPVTNTSATEAVSSSTPMAPATTPATGEQADVLDAYLKAAAALEEAQRRADPLWPPLEQYWTGDILKELRRQLSVLQANGWVIRGTTTNSPRVVSRSGSQAVIVNCIKTDAERYDAKTGEVKDPTGPLTVGFRESLTNEGGQWRISGRVKEPPACGG